MDRVQLVSPSLVEAARISASGNGTAELTNPKPAYQMLSLGVFLPASLLPTQLNYSSVVFYSSQLCVDAGVWKDDGQGGCLPCPVGAMWSAQWHTQAVRAGGSDGSGEPRSVQSPE